ncbi:hypothetical protein VB264_12565 [Arcicella aquatica]|uniref:Tetratricopeptide repeat protein n=1 Tax=Arcicella aquatica TaxID=217141 RepID=A0ABU5QQD5_9BACT|nr:hypothetical protein [Arcicella aquatica]MEA5258621.1 hypothetical protein [Arcicella aquatica]
MKQIILLSIVLFLNCSGAEDCPQNINILPMYGGVKKCKEQIEIDKDFLNECDRFFKNRNKAISHHLYRAWEYYYKNDFDTSMKRFNQAWLLDSTNADVYWGFGNILGRQLKFDESLIYFNKSLKLNAKNSKVWLSRGTSYAQMFIKNNDIKLLNKAIDNFRISVELDNKNVEAYSQLAIAYSYYMEKDSALVFLKITDKLDPNAINSEARKFILEK